MEEQSCEKEACMPSESHRSKPSFLSDVYILMASQVIITILAIGTSVITARALGVEGRGHFTLALLLASLLVTFTDFGMGTSGPRFTAMRQWSPPVIIGSHALAGAVRVLITGVLGLLLIAFMRHSLFPGIPADFLILGLLQLIPSTIAGFILPLLLGLGLAATYSRLLVLSSALAFGALSAGWVIVGLDVRIALLLQFVAGLVTSVIIWRRVSLAAGGIGHPNIRYLVEAYRFGMGVYTSNVASFINTRVILLLINGYIGAAAVGLYTIAQTATERIYLLADAMGTILLPRIAEDPERNSTRLTPVVFRLALIIGAGISIVLAIFSEWIVRFLFTDAFVGAVPSLQLLLVAVVLSSGWRVISQDLNGQGYSKQTALVNCCTAIASLGLAVVLLPWVGLEGAALSIIASAGLSLFLGIWLYGRYCCSSKHIAVLFMPSKREREFIARIMRGAVYVGQLGLGFAWALARAYLIDGVALRLAATVAPFKRRITDIVTWLGIPFMLHSARKLQIAIASRENTITAVQLEELGLPDETVKKVRALSRDNPAITLGEFDHYGWLVHAYSPIENMPCKPAEQARPRARGRTFLIATSRGIGVCKAYKGKGAKRRFLCELRILERLRESGARIPQLMAIDVDALTLTMTFIPGMDFERMLEAKGAQLTGEAIRERLRGNPSDQLIFNEYINEGAKFSSQLDPLLLESIHEQVRIVHRHGVELYDIKYGNVIIHRDTGLPYLIDFDGARLHKNPQSLAFLIERDRDIKQLNKALGTAYLTYDRIRDKIRRRDFPAADQLYASTYIGHGLHIGPLWDRATGFGRWHYILKQNLHLKKGARILSLGPNNASIELQLLREGAEEVIAYERDEEYAAQGRFLKAACEWADNKDYRLQYVIADMQEAAKIEGKFDCVLALCSLYYLPEEEIYRIARIIVQHSPRFVLLCNIRKGIDREEPDQYRRASVEFAEKLLRDTGFSNIIIAAPKGYSRPLVQGFI